MASSALIALKETPPAAYPLGAGLLVTSSIFFGNVGLALTGPLPIIKEQLGASKLNTKQKVRVWRLFFDEAAKHIVVGTGVTAAMHLGAALLAKSPAVRKLSLASAVFSAIVLPYTLKVIMPTNNALIELDNEATAENDEQKTGELIQTWDRLHKYRFFMYGSAWLSGLAAFVKAF